MEPIAHLRKAKQAIQSEGSAKSRLQTAAHEFWNALFDLETWPPELREGAQHITSVILADGCIGETVNRMDEETAQETLQRLSDFCDKAESIWQG